MEELEMRSLELWKILPKQVRVVLKWYEVIVDCLDCYNLGSALSNGTEAESKQ